MLDDNKSNNRQKLEENNSLDVNLAHKKIAPPPPLITNIDQRIQMLEKKGVKRGKRNFWIGILSSIIILFVVCCVGYYLLLEINRIVDKVNVDNNNVINIVKDSDNLCSKEDACCLTSLSRLRKNGYMLIDELGVCPEGLESNMLKCKTSLSWCEPIEADIEKIVKKELIAIDSTDIDTSNWERFENLDFGFSFNYPSGFYVQSEELNSDAITDIRKIYVMESATSSDYYFILKIIKTMGSSSVEDYITDQTNILNNLASSSGVISSLVTKKYTTKNIDAKKIITTSSFNGDVNINEEVVLANDKYVFAITYPHIIANSVASSQANIMKAMVISFSLIEEATNKLDVISEKNSTKIDSNLEDNELLVDTDGDGLSDEDELLYNSDPQKIDTDGDGFSDGDEVKNGYNPVGEGLL